MGREGVMVLDLDGLPVLVVEDQYLLADELGRALKEWNAQVVGPTASVQNALQLIEERDVSLALLDINLGRGSVYPVAEALRTKGVPLIFITGYANHDIRVDFRDAPYIEKPFTPGELAAFIRHFSEARQRDTMH